MDITEPTTMITDYALAALVIFFASRLFRHGRREDQTAPQLWAGAFFLTGVGAMLGGTSHGFALYLSDGAKAFVWKATVYSIGVASFCLLAGAFAAGVRQPLRGWLVRAAALKLLVYATWMAWHDEFRYVVYDYIPSMLIVLGFAAWAAYRRPEEGARWILGGILVSFIAAGIQVSGFKLHEQFNHNDLYHVLQMAAFFLFYRGGLLLRDRQSRLRHA